MADQDIKYKVTAVTSQGEIVAVYTTENGRRDAVRALNDTYGSCEVEEVGPDDVPDDLERI